jgi:hypothetical protein
MSQMLDYINQMIEDRKALLHASQNSLSDLEDVANDAVLVELLDLRRRAFALQEDVARVESRRLMGRP